jgi:hypothetical protein
MNIAAMKLALEALERAVSTCFDRRAHEDVMSRPEHFINQTITALRTAIAEAESVKPIAWANINKHGDITHTNNKRMPWSKTPLYTTPPAAQRQPLTEEQLKPIADEYRILFGGWVVDFARAIEAAHGIKETNT